MIKKLLFISFLVLFAFGILFTSVFRTASVKYEFADSTPAAQEETQVLGENTANIDYYLAYPGKVFPDSPLWPLKAIRDRIWLWITTNPSRKAELKLLFADKRVAMSKVLFEKDKPEVGFSTLTKAEKYLEEASNMERENATKNIDTSEFLTRIAKASLKHVQVMEEILPLAPEDAKPGVLKTMDYAKRVYEQSRNGLLEKGLPVPINPFDWE